MSFSYLYYMRPEKYLKYLIDPIFNPHRTKEIFSYNPTVQPERKEAECSKIFVYNYNPHSLSEHELKKISETFVYCSSEKVSWINIDGLVKADVETVCRHFD